MSITNTYTLIYQSSALAFTGSGGYINYNIATPVAVLAGDKLALFANNLAPVAYRTQSPQDSLAEVSAPQGFIVGTVYPAQAFDTYFALNVEAQVVGV